MAANPAGDDNLAGNTFIDSDGDLHLNGTTVYTEDATFVGQIVGTSATKLIGYGTGAGGAVTQITSRATGVTLSKPCGAITTDTTSLAAGAEATFTVTNTLVAATDVVVVSARSGQTAGTSVPTVTTVAAGSFDITLTNLHASTADTGAMIINFAVFKSVAA
jgi:hypothetical protein